MMATTTSTTTTATTTTTTDASSSSGSSGCTVLDNLPVMQFGDDGEFLFAIPILGDQAKPDEFDILFYGDPYVPAVGSYNLASAGINDNYATCKECVYIYQDVVNDVEEKLFFQSQGTLEITETDPMAPNVSKGSLKNVRLVEVTLDMNFSSTPVPNGACYDIPLLEWDFTP